MLVGESNEYFDVRALVREHGLEDRVEITGHLNLADFQRHIAETDIAINLRERIIGETSGSLCRIMAAGVPAIVSNAAWFGELPDDTVVKIDMSQHTDALFEAYLETLIVDSSLRNQIRSERAPLCFGAQRYSQKRRAVPGVYFADSRCASRGRFD